MIFSVQRKVIRKNSLIPALDQVLVQVALVIDTRVSRAMMWIWRTILWVLLHLDLFLGLILSNLHRIKVHGRRRKEKLKSIVSLRTTKMKMVVMETILKTIG